MPLPEHLAGPLARALLPAHREPDAIIIARHNNTAMINKLLLVAPVLLLSSGQVLGTTTAQEPPGYESVIVLREQPRKALPHVTECPEDAAVAAYHRPAQNGVLNNCETHAAKPTAGRRVPVSVRSAP